MRRPWWRGSTGRWSTTARPARSGSSPNWSATDPIRYRGIVGLATDWRIWRSRDAGAAGQGINFFVGGAIETYGRLVWSIEEVEATLSEWVHATPV